MYNFNAPSRYTIREQVLDEGKISELGISRVFRHDTGLFTCHAKNNFGQDQMSIQLIVQGMNNLSRYDYAEFQVVI